MKSLIYCGGLWLAAALALLYRTAAQAVASADSSALVAAVAAARASHTRATRPESRLLSGTEYVNYTRPNTVGHQFFQSAIAQPGGILYDGEYFAAAPLLYDLNLDQVVLLAPERDASLQLLAEKVGAFSIGGHQFVRFVSPDTTAGVAMPTGFYDLLLAGSGRGVSLLARRTKRSAQEPVAGHLVFEYQESSRLFVQKGNSFTAVGNLQSILSLLPEQKAGLQKFARSNRLKIKGDGREDATAALLRYYNTLVQ